MKVINKHSVNDMKIATSLYKSAFYKQAKNLDKEINVAYGKEVTKNNLEDVKLIIDYEMKALDLDVKYGLITRNYSENQKNVLSALKKSVDKTISELF